MENLKKYLPSKKFLIILSSVIVALAIIFIAKVFIDIRKKTEIEKEIVTKKAIALREEFLELDSDNDGLKDWEESLWQTDPNNPDTDGDKTLDGQEIKSYRNPLVPAPNDILDQKEIAENKQKIDEFESLNQTEKFSRLLFSQYIATQGTNQVISGDDANYLVQDLLNSLPKGELPDKYQIKDLTINTGASAGDLIVYRDRVRKILDDNFWPYFLVKDITYFQNAVEANNEKDLAKLDPIISSYKTASLSITKLKTPEIYQNNGVKVANLLYNIAVSLENMKVVFSDSISAMIYYDTFFSYYSSLEQELATLSLYNN